MVVWVEQSVVLFLFLEVRDCRDDDIYCWDYGERMMKINPPG
jgi:hypothetical protein